MCSVAGVIHFITSIWFAGPHPILVQQFNYHDHFWFNTHSKSSIFFTFVKYCVQVITQSNNCELYHN